MAGPFKRILIAGATGMVGSSLVRRFSKAYPHQKMRGTFNSNPPVLRHDSIEYIQADLTDRTACRRVAHDCDCVIMAAANTGGAASSASEPSLQVSENLVMDAFLLEACQIEGVKKVVFLSSATVYQEFDGFIREDDLDLNQDPHPAYLGVGWAKRSAEKLCAFWQKTSGMSIIILRLANIFGPFARFDPKRSNFIPAIIRKACDHMDPFEVWGNPEVTRDVLFTEDFAEAVEKILSLDVSFEIFNLGSGVPVKVREVVDAACLAAQHFPKEVVFSHAGPTTIHHRAMDCKKIMEAIEWRPRISLSEAVQMTTDWWKRSRGSWTR